MVATFNSTGQPSIFLHAADAIHGDLGNIQKEDIVIFISKSGNTSEIKTLLPYIKKMGNLIISITGNIESYLAKESDYIIDLGPEGGNKGGNIIYEGTLEKLIGNKKSHTGKHLALEFNS